MSAPARDTAPNGAAVRLHDVRIIYGGDPVAEVDLSIESGEIVVLLGPSGCGKSTLLRALSGLITPAEGTAMVDGRVVGSGAEQCAMVFQEDALLPWRTAIKNIEFALKLRGVPRHRRRAEALDLLDQVGLNGYGDHLPIALSGGMRQRVQLARTLATQPRVLLMDEPFGALDAQTRADMQRLLIAVWQSRRTTIVFVTHDVDEALLLADRIVLLSARPARIQRLVTVSEPRAPGARFEPEFARLRYEILAALGETADSVGEFADMIEN
ncbi:ATP-binding cassette domain-containing protein [Nocardia sp. ET3-3]|uniref:ATP-binding cassette domain-containing protein n=1 Tax=Nocardia terrae TaxID=2675851 RepID=A0A7K1UTV5_9NOCA|nr:ABC transporter ATP-binding protein [Nocardia terrae]MVU77599.1 ATP-binding cassette domain-containing protein [Nocardia terrae]